MPSKAALAKIHIAKKELTLTDDEYRAVLYGVAKKDSSKDLTDRQAEMVISRFKELGWKPKSAKKAGTVRQDRQPLSLKIRALWLELHAAGKVKDSSEKALCSYVHRMTGVSALQWLTVRQAIVVVEALKKWLERQP